jgi:hypothetical protein
VSKKFIEADGPTPRKAPEIREKREKIKMIFTSVKRM